MLGRTHILFAVVCGLFYTKLFHPPLTWLFIGITVIATLLPDLDETNSMLGRRIKPVSWFLKFFLGHRGIWHSLWIPLIIYIILSAYHLQQYAIAVILGYIVHLIADSLTIEGINFLYPLQFQIRGFIRTGSVVESVFALACVVMIVYLLFH